MNKFRLHLSFWLCIALLSFIPILSPEEQGREIFEKGSSQSGEPIVALMSGVEVPATVLPCASCHGPDGKGRPEGGVEPSDIRWPILTKEKASQNGRNHQPYDARSLKRAISMGLDPAGNELNPAMPRYRMSLADMDALVRYIQVLGIQNPTGITDSSIRIACLLEGTKGAESMNQALLDCQQAYFNHLNEQGGIYGRKIDLKGFEQNDSNLEAELLEWEPLAIVGGMPGLLDAHLIKAVNKVEIPWIGALSDHAHNGLSNQQVFFLAPGREAQLTHLAQTVQKHLPQTQHWVIVYSETQEKMAQAVFDQLNGWELQPLNHANIQDSSSLLLMIDSPSQFSLENMPHIQSVMVMGSDFSASFFAKFQPKKIPVFLSYPNPLQPLTQDGQLLYKQLQVEQELKVEFKGLQYQNLHAAVVLTEIMKKAGHSISRSSLLQSAEKLYAFQTGFGPALTFHANRRIGSEKVFVIEVDWQNGLRPID